LFSLFGTELHEQLFYLYSGVIPLHIMYSFLP
jgi:hypothetical protein